MKPNSSSRKWFAAAITLGVFGVIIVATGCPRLEPGKPDGARAVAGEQDKDKAKAKATEKVAEKADKAANVSDVARLWPMFGGTIQRNMVNTTEKNIPGTWEVDIDKEERKPSGKGKNVKWVATLGSRAYGGPVIAGGKIFVGTNNEAPRDPKIKGDKGIVMCFRESDGAFLWQAVHDKLPSGNVNDWPQEGICSTAVVEGDRVYYVSNRCDVVCADVNGDPATKSAKFIWHYDMMKELNVFPHNLAACSPLLVGDTLFVVTANGVDEGHINIPSPDAPSFIALDKVTGKLKWKSTAPGKNIMHGQWSNAVYATINGKPQVVFPGGDGWLHAFEPGTGKDLWKFDANPKDSKYELGGRGTKSDFIATPVVYDNKLYIGTGQDPEHYEGVGHLWCIDMTKSGDVSPDLVTDDKVFPPKTKPNPNSAVVWHFGGPAPKEVREKIGRDYEFGRTMSTCAIHDGIVYAAELAGYMHCLDAKTGKQLWVYDLKSGVWGSPYWVDNKVILGTDDGTVWVFKHGKELAEPTKIDHPHPVKSSAVAVNGVLYVMTESHLYAIANK